MPSIKKLRYGITLKGNLLIDKVRKGEAQTHDELRTADFLDYVSKNTNRIYSRLGSFPSNEGTIRKLEKDGYIRSYTDPWLDEWDMLFGEEEEISENTESDISGVTSAGMVLLGLISKDVSLPEKECRLGQWLWHYVSSEGREIPPWVEHALITEGYIREESTEVMEWD